MAKQHRSMDPIWMIIIGVLLVVFRSLGELVAIVVGIIMVILGIRRLIARRKGGERKEA